MTDDIDKMTLQELLDYRPPTWWQQMERRFFDNPVDPPKELRFCGHHYVLSEKNRWAAFTDDEIHEMLRAVPDDDKPFWHEVRAEAKRRKNPNN